MQLQASALSLLGLLPRRLLAQVEAGASRILSLLSEFKRGYSHAVI